MNSLTLNEDGNVVSCAKGDLNGCGYTPGAKVCGKCGAQPKMADDDDDEMDSGDNDDMDEMSAPKGWGSMTPEMRARARARRRQSLGVKSGEFGDDAFLCGIERKVLPGGAAPCAGCTGGCKSEAGFPTLLEVEGVAEEMFGGKVLDSGYGDRADLFLVDVRRKDGKVVEAFFDGQTGEMQGWQLLHDDVLGEKSAAAGMKVIGSDEAADVAVKSLPGEVLAVEAELFELEDGTKVDSWVVEIDAANGKSYDAYVSLDGELLGYDEFDLTDDDDDEDGGDEEAAVARDGEVAAIGLKDDADQAIADDVDLDDVDVKDDEAASTDDTVWAALAEFQMLAAEIDLDSAN